MTAKIVVPDHIKPEEAASYRQFCVAQQLQQLLVEHEFSKLDAAMICTFVAALCLEQVEHPGALQGAAQQMMDTFQGRVERVLGMLLADPTVRLRMSAQTPLTARTAVKAALREKLTFNITESLFKKPSEPTSKIELAS